MCAGLSVFAAVDLFPLKFYVNRVVPINQRHWWRPHPSAFPRSDTIPECDWQTDGQTICSSIYSAV